MRKVFLYLYPVKEFSDVIYKATNYYDLGLPNPFDILNKCIQKRYRDQEYEIIFLKYPDKDIYGININNEDQIINTNISFIDATNNNMYPSEDDIYYKVGLIDQIVIGGYHHSDCVRRVAEYYNKKGINTLIDLDLTDLFFSRYDSEDFEISEYNLESQKNQLIDIFKIIFEEEYEQKFNEIYGSSIYQFNTIKLEKNKKL